MQDNTFATDDHAAIDSGDVAPATNSLTEQMHKAYEAGDKERAQAILDRMNAAQGEQLPPAVEQGEAVESVPVDKLEQVREQLEALGGEDLVQEWGSDLGKNLGYARYATEALSPAALEYFTTAVEREDGSVYVPGDDPSIIKLAAQVGRLLAHRQGAEVSPIKGKQDMSSRVNFEALNEASKSLGKGRSGGSHQMTDITRQIFDALDRGDRVAAKRLEKERDTLSRRLYGNQPIVGSGGRSV